MRRLPKPHRLLFFLAADLGLSIVLFAGSRRLFPSLLFLFIAGGFQTTFLSATVTLLRIHTDETNRGRILSLFGLTNRGLGPMGSFPFALIATTMTPFTTPFITPFMTPFITHL